MVEEREDIVYIFEAMKSIRGSVRAISARKERDHEVGEASDYAGKQIKDMYISEEMRFLAGSMSSERSRRQKRPRRLATMAVFKAYRGYDIPRCEMCPRTKPAKMENT